MFFIAANSLCANQTNQQQDWVSRIRKHAKKRRLEKNDEKLPPHTPLGAIGDTQIVDTCQHILFLYFAYDKWFCVNPAELFPHRARRRRSAKNDSNKNAEQKTNRIRNEPICVNELTERIQFVRESLASQVCKVHWLNFGLFVKRK